MSYGRTEGFTVNLTNKVDLPDLSFINELARELNFEFSGAFVRVPPILEDLHYIFRQEREECEDFDINTHLFSRDTIKEVLQRDLTESEEAYYGYTTKFLLGLNYAAAPGYSPMDKALRTIMYMTYLSKKNQDQHDSRNNPAGNRKQTLSPEDLEQLIKEMSNGVPDGDQAGGAKNAPELSKDVISCVRDHLYDLSPTIANIYAQDKVEDVPINLNIIRDLKIKSYLEEKIGLETTLETKLEVNNKSRKRRSTGMTSYTQLMKTSKTQMVMPDFDDKFAKKELVVREKVLPQTRKQVVTLLLDDSGSMGSIQKQSFVRATLLKYLEGVMEGKAKLNFYLYESKRYGYKEVKTLDDAQKLFKDISLRRPSGGGTHIGYCLQETIDEIATDSTYHDPEITILLDGDDHVNPKEVNTKGVKINALCFGTENPGLKVLCAESGGFYKVESMYNRY